MFLYKYWDGQNKHISVANKIVIGMVFACIAMLLAGSIEIARQKGCSHPINGKKVCQPLTADLLPSSRHKYFQVYLYTPRYLSTPVWVFLKYLLWLLVMNFPTMRLTVQLVHCS